MEFNPIIIECVKKLREKYASRRHCVMMAYPIIEVLKYSRTNRVETEVSTKLFYYPQTNSFEMQASDQRYYSKLSYFDYDRAERRWNRNMNHLFPLIKDLKECGLWDYISNKNLLILNQYNNKADEKKRVKLLDLILSDEDGA